MLDKAGLLSDEQLASAVAELSDADLLTSEQEVVDGTIRVTVRASERLQNAINGAALRKALVDTTLPDLIA